MQPDLRRDGPGRAIPCRGRREYGEHDRDHHAADVAELRSRGRVALDSTCRRALTEPARLELLKLLLMRGSANLGTLAGSPPQDRSVISRHLTVLHQAGTVRTERKGRERTYIIGGPAIFRAFERILVQATAITARCCKRPTRSKE